jgi:hypothetical protein
MGIGLKINQNKTKYMAMNARRLLEHVHTFTCLGTEINKENDITEEVRNRIAAAYRCYFILHKHFKSNFICRMTKILLYKTVRPVVLYRAECWTLFRTNEKMVDVFENKIL